MYVNFTMIVDFSHNQCVLTAAFWITGPPQPEQLRIWLLMWRALLSEAKILDKIPSTEPWPLVIKKVAKEDGKGKLRGVYWIYIARTYVGKKQERNHYVLTTNCPSSSLLSLQAGRRTWRKGEK